MQICLGISELIFIGIFSIVSFFIPVADEPMQERTPGETSSDAEETSQIFQLDLWFSIGSMLYHKCNR